MNNPAPYHFYIQNGIFLKERLEHGDGLFKAVIDHVVCQIAPNPLDSYSRDKLTAGISELYGSHARINAIKQRLNL